ncbi:leucine-rich repeat-containing protein 4B-like [Penaeus monodon]|uniref:leucine-rich repeat-containing protein 4B-like n=1 Tax=Penaeus monodon TaxID=6687 RepID=UPI0018A7BB29|nr:leucine-rich repeat-containing protein 4B-like [Penaeus monodon]
MVSTVPSLLAISLLLVVVLAAAAMECPCSWREDNRSWDCVKDDVISVPTVCWPLHANVDKIVFQNPMREVYSGDFDHENLRNLTKLQMQNVDKIADDALHGLTALRYLDLSGGNLKHLPDLSTLAEVVALEAGGNLLVEAPSLAHMKNLDLVSLFNNRIQFVPDAFLPASPVPIGMTMVRNNFTDLNATSIVNAAAQSSFVFDDLQYLWATVEERDTILEKEFYCNIDLESIIRVTDDPTNP